MCQSYSSGLCGEQIPNRDMGDMPSARATPPDVPAVLTAVHPSPTGEYVFTPAEAAASPTDIHYGTPNGAFLRIYCNVSTGYATDRLGDVTCPSCIELVRAEAAGAAKIA